MKIKKILCFLLAAVLVIEGGEGLVSRKAEAAINYTGSYYKHIKTKKYEEEYGISMKKKSAYKGKIGLFKQDAYMGGDDRIVCDININLYKVGKNSYEGKKGQAKIKVKVYKNKIVIKQKGNTEGLYTDMSGTYKKMKK